MINKMNSIDIIITITSQVFKQLPITNRKYSITYSYEHNVVGLWTIEVSELTKSGWNKHARQISDYELNRVVKDNQLDNYISNTVQQITTKAIYNN